MYTLRFVLVLLVVGGCGAGHTATAATYHVADPKGPDGVAGTADDADAKDSYPGMLDKPFATLAKACSVVAPGDTVKIRGGVYRQILRPQSSGTVESPITFQAYPGETVTIRDVPAIHGLTQDETDLDHDGDSIGIYMYGRSYITLVGLTVTHVGTWARIVYSDHIVIRGCNLSNATGGGGPRGGIRFGHSDDNIITGNTISGGSDNIGLIHSDRNLVEGNSITSGRHTLWTIHAGNFNIIRNNYFYNAIQKIGEIFDADVDLPIAYDATKHNLVEHNIFAYTPPALGGNPYSGIQYAGQNGIIRNNVFYDCHGIGLQMCTYSEEALWNTHNRVFHNTFYNNTGGGIETGTAADPPWYSGYNFIDNIFKNNIVYKNEPQPEAWMDNKLGGSQITHRLGQGFVFTNNNILGDSPGEDDVIFIPISPRWYSLADAETVCPLLYVNNMEVDPKFVDADTYDFHLDAGSRMIDAGAWLTQAVGTGSGTVLPVLDATYFFDGFGMTDENGGPLPGDLIQLKGDTRTTRVLAIDYAANTLTLDQALTWADGQGVALRYSGSRPDIGAYEYANESPTGINLSDTTVAENQPVGAAVGTLSTVDPDAGDTFTYALVPGTGSMDNASFTITGNTLQTAAVFDYEAKSSYSIRVRSTDAGGLWTEKAFAITVTDVNEAPVISNQAFSVPENCPNGAVVGTVLASDPDAGQTLVYAIAAGNTDDAFAIDAATGQLTVANASALDAETTPTFSLTVQVTDNGTPALAATATVTVAVKEHLTVTGVMLNGRAGRSASAIEPSGLGAQSLQVTFSRTATFGPEAVLVQTVAFTGNAETVTGTLMPASLAGSGTSVMTLALAPGSVVDTWVKVTLRGDGTVHGVSGQALDGESKGGSGRSYVYDASLDLPTGNGSPGGDAVFYVGSLRGDFSGDGLVRDEDFEGFFGAWEAGRPEADFCGVGFGESQPDGQVSPSDIDGFLSAYNRAVAEGRHLDSLPDPGPLAQGVPGPLATGSPEPVAPAPEDPFAASAAEADVLGVVPEISFAEAPGAAPGGATPDETPQQILLPASVAAGGGEPVQTADWLVASDVPLAFGAADELAPLSPDPVLAPDGGLDLLGLSAPVL
ncbi:MAG: cadherin domain-containing protein [Planctomycetota bacterium]|nr:cadherin domain-containing protein [Planctomycetota bacterium]